MKTFAKLSIAFLAGAVSYASAMDENGWASI
jgi:hypothetical protein